MNFKKLQAIAEAVNTYYAFIVLLYAAALFTASYSRFFIWVLALTTPLIAGWTGYLLHGYLQQRNQRHGFRLMSNVMWYEISSSKKYTLRLEHTLKACRDHLSVYSIGYQWSGKGRAETPKLANQSQQQLLSVIKPESKADDMLKPEPYMLNSPEEGSWNYWFIAFSPLVQKGDVVEVDYSQTFHDEENAAKPYVYYVVRTPMDKLELNVKFPKNALPQKVTASYTKPTDSRRPIESDSLVFDPEKQWATWVVEKPKRNYCYRIDWQ